MKEVKFLLAVFITATYTSAWWAFARWGSFSAQNDRVSLVGLFMILYTIGIVVYCGVYLINNWDKDRDR